MQGLHRRRRLPSPTSVLNDDIAKPASPRLLAPHRPALLPFEYILKQRSTQSALFHLPIFISSSQSKCLHDSPSPPSPLLVPSPKFYQSRSVLSRRSVTFVPKCCTDLLDSPHSVSKHLSELSPTPISRHVYPSLLCYLVSLCRAESLCFPFKGPGADPNQFSPRMDR